MTAAPRYPIAAQILATCRGLGISPEAVCRRAGLSPAMVTGADRGLTAEQCLALWQALDAEASRPTLPVDLARISARGTFVPALFAFSCSPTVEAGFRRLAVFKPLVGPVELSATRKAGRFTVELRSTARHLAMPPALAAFEMAYLTEITRVHTGREITPTAAALPLNDRVAAILKSYLGCNVTDGSHVSLQLPEAVADLPLISEDPALWEMFEPSLRRQLMDFRTVQPVAARVRQTLLELLPGGRSSSQAVAERLNLSKRSLNRRLADDGTSFQRVLDETRKDLATHYLGQPDIRVEEISHLVGYADPNSFYRAFRSWTGQSPMQMRAALGARNQPQ